MHDDSIFFWTPRFAESSFRICVVILKSPQQAKLAPDLVVDDLRSSDRYSTDTTFKLQRVLRHRESSVRCLYLCNQSTVLPIRFVLFCFWVFCLRLFLFPPFLALMDSLIFPSLFFVSILVSFSFI